MSALAVSLDVAVICYCADELTDGLVDDVTIYKLVSAPRKQVQRAILVLEKVRRLTIHDSFTWKSHDFLDFNPPASSILAKRERANQKKRRQRMKSEETSLGDNTWAPVAVDERQAELAGLTEQVLNESLAKRELFCEIDAFTACRATKRASDNHFYCDEHNPDNK